MIVVDASVLANALADDGVAGGAARTVLRGQRSINAPALIDVETVSVLRRLWLAGSLSDSRFGRAVDDLTTLPIIRHSVTRLVHRALAVRAIAPASEALYVALAEVLAGTRVTRDRRLASAPGVRCRVEIVS